MATPSPHPGSFDSLPQLLRTRAAQAATAGHTWDLQLLHTREEPGPWGRTAGPGHQFTHADTLGAARAAAAHLEDLGVRPGDRVLLVLPTGFAFIVCFYACLLLGAAAVPVVPPWSLTRLRGHVERIGRIARICEAKATVTPPEMLDVLKSDAAGTSALEHFGVVVPPVELLIEASAPAREATPSPEDTAFIQFTSGSLGDPKGVVVSHRCALANLHGIGTALRLTQADVGCSWLPLYHDMGLIGHLLVPMMWRVPTVLLPPELFMRTPRIWLETISTVGATVSTAPNFAYDLAARRVRDDEIERLDLSRWRVAMCGGEPVMAETLTRFSQKLARAGFRYEAFRPVYGLAESVLGVAFPPDGHGPRIDPVLRRRLQSDAKAESAPDAGAARQISNNVSVGRALPGHELRVVSPEGEPLAERSVGFIETRGPSVAAGYLHDDGRIAPFTQNDSASESGWLRTGDLGYLADGDLFVTGRRSEVILKGGRNLFPYDIEAAASGVDGVRGGRCVALGVPNAAAGTEDLILVCETQSGSPETHDALERTLRRTVFEATGAHPDLVMLAPPGTLTKTSSGKLQRLLMRERLAKGQSLGAAPNRWLLAKLWARRLWRRLASAPEATG